MWATWVKRSRNSQSTCGDGDRLELPTTGWTVQGAFSDVSRLVPVHGVAAQHVDVHGVPLAVEPFRFLASDWRLLCAADPSLSFGRDDVRVVHPRTANGFDAGEHEGVPCRLRTPDTAGARPLLLFLHGGGEGGSDNWLQPTGTLRACAWAERYPELIVLAPCQ